MHTTLPLSAVRPPDIEDGSVLHIPAPDELRSLALMDRLSFRIGLWLMERAQRPHAHRMRTPAEPLVLSDHALSTQRASMALLAFDLHRQMR